MVECFGKLIGWWWWVRAGGVANGARLWAVFQLLEVYRMGYGWCIMRNTSCWLIQGSRDSNFCSRLKDLSGLKVNRASWSHLSSLLKDVFSKFSWPYEP